MSFNTQPPEGGWEKYGLTQTQVAGFNTQPPEGGWQIYPYPCTFKDMFQHTAARRRLGEEDSVLFPQGLFQHTAARRRLDLAEIFGFGLLRFQHTAARRRLALLEKE